MIHPPASSFRPSQLQSDFFRFVREGRGSAVLEAVAGSGKSTTIVQTLRFIPEGAAVLILAFNADVVKDMKLKVAKLGEELGRPMRGVRVSTFHGLGMGALLKRWGVPFAQVKVEGSKLRTLAEQLWNEETLELYGTFCSDLVSLMKGEGMGALDSAPVTADAMYRLIEHHDLELSSQDADFETAIRLSRELLERSNQVAKEKLWIDYDDQLYLPLKWRLRFFGQAHVFVDEAQDTNPVRRAIARLCVATPAPQWGREAGRLYAVGDRRQAIYGFTGATHNALDLIAQDFGARRMPLNVSYRCPKSALQLTAPIAPEFKVHPDAREGQVLRGVSVDDALKILRPSDAVLCRNVAPLVTLCYGLLRRGVACHVLGREIGTGLVKLVKAMRAKSIDGMLEKLEEYREREVAKFLADKKEQKAEAVEDRVACVKHFVEGLDENSRTLPKLIAAIETVFADKAAGITLSTVHKAKGREWERVAVLREDLMPSKWARQEWQHEQELNLCYVRDTRFTDTMIFLRDDGSEKRQGGAK